MTYNADTYREKREKVLGVRKRGLSFGVAAVVVSLIIIVGLGAVALPKALTWLQTRHLDDAIYKRRDGHPWPPDVGESLRALPGVRNAVADKKGTRLVVTFDRRVMDAGRITAHLSSLKLEPDLLNQTPHGSGVTSHESAGGDES